MEMLQLAEVEDFLFFFFQLWTGIISPQLQQINATERNGSNEENFALQRLSADDVHPGKHGCLHRFFSRSCLSWSPSPVIDEAEAETLSITFQHCLCLDKWDQFHQNYENMSKRNTKAHTFSLSCLNNKLGVVLFLFISTHCLHGFSIYFSIPQRDVDSALWWNVQYWFHVIHLVDLYAWNYLWGISRKETWQSAVSMSAAEQWVIRAQLWPINSATCSRSVNHSGRMQLSDGSETPQDTYATICKVWVEGKEI